MIISQNPDGCKQKSFVIDAQLSKKQGGIKQFSAVLALLLPAGCAAKYWHKNPFPFCEKVTVSFPFPC
jgi:hypothetical protein